MSQILNAKTQRPRRRKELSEQSLRLCFIASLRFVFLFLIAGCIPARVPSNLDNTPGPAVIVADGYYQGSAFTARYLAGWRIVTSEASAPPSVIFVAPDEKSTIRLSVAPIDLSGLDPTFQIEQREIRLPGGLTIYAVLHAAVETSLLSNFEDILASLRQS